MKNLTPVTREEKYLHAIATHGEVNIVPVTTEEKLLDSIVRDEPIAVNPKTRREYFLNEIVNNEQTNKTYILEPTELELEEYVEKTLILDDANTVYESIAEGAIIEFSGTKLKYSGLNNLGNKTFTPDGTVPETEPENYASIEFLQGQNDNPDVLGLVYNHTGTFTVSIYTETDGSNDSETRFLTPVTREEKYLHAIATGEVIDLTPANDEEKLLDAIVHGEERGFVINPKTRAAYFLAKIAGANIIGEDDKQQQEGGLKPTPVVEEPGERDTEV